VIIGCAILVLVLITILIWLLIVVRKKNKMIVAPVEKLDDNQAPKEQLKRNLSEELILKAKESGIQLSDDSQIKRFIELYK